MSWLQSSKLALGLAFVASSASAAQFDVTVGKGGQLKFEPETLTAAVGDVVTYHYFAKNHAVAQSTFDDPCKLQDNGIFSGFIPNTSPDVEAPTTFSITVNDTKPSWFYCPQTNGDHCQNGMVHSINAPASGNTFDAYKAKAQQAAKPSTPAADVLPAGGLRKLHIDVGFDGQLVFNPNNVTEPVGTILEFSYNPANHSIVQSSFDEPCQPLKTGGFVAPFVPTQQTPSGVTFEVPVTDDKPVWFYCAQTAKTHCQAGMVGSVNAAPEGDKTFQAFKDLAAKAPPSTITPDTPLVGTLEVNDTIIAAVGGAVLNTTGLDPSLIYDVPPPGSNYSPYIGGMAGGNQPAEYQWPPTLSDEAEEYLLALVRISEYVAVLLVEGYSKLNEGPWAGVYPASIKNTLASLAAQSLIHRKTYTDSLQHYNKPTGTDSTCRYKLDFENVDAWLGDARVAVDMHIGALLDVTSLAAKSDPWMVPVFASALGSEARMSAVINMMQNHIASPAPREALLPYQLGVSHILQKYVVEGSCGDAGGQDKVLPELVIKSQTVDPTSGRLTSVTVDMPEDSTGEHYLAVIGAWGGTEYTPVDSNGVASIPEDMFGWVYLVLTTQAGVKTSEIETVASAGPASVWVKQQWAT